MPHTLTPAAFVAKWQQANQKEIALAQSHFNDVCALIGRPTPVEADPKGEFFSFEASTLKSTGQKGRADVFYREKFIWEYKGPHANLDKAYQQLLLYREELGNPPLLITSDTRTIIIHTNFTNRPKETHEISLERLQSGDGVALLRRVFDNPESFQPAKTKQIITKASADSFIQVADQLKAHRLVTKETHTDEELAHFLVRLLFCLFAEDLNLLPNNIFTTIVRAQGRSFDNLQKPLEALFQAMQGGGQFGLERIRYFDGTLFDKAFVPTIPVELGTALLRTADQDWSSIDPAIFGTLFERIIDENKRAQLGAHYTSQDDINLIVEPVLMQPLRDEWATVRQDCLRQPAHAPDLLAVFHAKVAATRVLDPACGSGNFLYVALQKLLDLQKEVIVFAQRHEYPALALTVSPQQLYGIEINPYAHELAQITVWIGYLQWRAQNGFEEMDDPILRPLGNIQRMDAILAYDADGRPVEPAWPAAEVIIGNPPFLGDKRMRAELGSEYVEIVRSLYLNAVPGGADLVLYWFEKARKQIQHGRTQRAGLIATNSIRGGSNREVLNRIKESGDIFMAWSDNPWILDGAAVRVSITGFDKGEEKTRYLNGKIVSTINSDLTGSIDITIASPLAENSNLSFIGTQKGGPFDITAAQASEFIKASNVSGKDNHDVIYPWMNGFDIVRRPRDMWVIDFGASMPIEVARQYDAVFKYVEEHIYPVREDLRRDNHRKYWWIHAEARPGMREALTSLSRFILSPRVAKHRIFAFVSGETLPDSATVAIARDDDYFFGVLHSTLHERWSLRMGTWLGKGNDPRYTPTTTFETFPFPWPPGQEPTDSPLVQAIATAAFQLNAWREAWLNPPAPSAGIIDVNAANQLKQRTLTNLYNGLVYYRTHRGPAFNTAAFHKETRKAVTRTQIQDLHDLHTLLDEAVCAAYGWPPTILADEEQILTRLLALNQERAQNQ